MGRPKGMTMAGIYPRDKHVRIPTGSEGAVRRAVLVWEVETHLDELRDLNRVLRELLRGSPAKSKTQAKRQAAAKRAKSKSSPATRKRAGIKKHSV